MTGHFSVHLWATGGISPVHSSGVQLLGRGLYEMLGRGVRPWAMQGNRKGPTEVVLVHSNMSSGKTSFGDLGKINLDLLIRI